MLDSNETNLDPNKSPDNDVPNMSVFDDKGSGDPSENPQDRSPIKLDEFIDPKFANLPKDEAIVRSAQSKIDQVNTALAQTEAKYENNLPLVRAFDQLTSDKAYLHAFVKQYDPEFFEQFSTSDITSSVKQQLSRKFGADFEPIPDEVGQYGSKSWEYDRAFNKLYDKLSNESPDSIKSLDVIVEERKVEQKKSDDKRKEEIQQIMHEESWNKEQVMYMMKWANGLSLFDIKKIFKFTIRHVDRAPSPTEVSGMLPGLPQFQQVQDLFGPPRSGTNFRKN